MDRSTQIGRLIRDIAGTTKPSFGHRQMIVKSVEGDTCTAMLDDMEVAGIRLLAVKDRSDKGILVTPAKDSVVLVADLSAGLLRELAVVGYSDIDSVTIHNGDNGGLVLVNDLTSKLNNLVAEVNALVSAYNGHTHTGSSATGGNVTTVVTTSQASAPSNFSASDYENTKIKQ